jgi:alpha-glucosidase
MLIPRNFAIAAIALLFSAVANAQPVITTPPAELKLSPFYKKYMDVNGLAVCSSERVPDSCFHAAYITFKALTEMLPQEVMQSLIDQGARVTIMAKDEMTTDVPEHAYLARDKKTNWDKRARGLGGTRWLPMSSCAEENILAYAEDRYRSEDITIHEFAHTIHNVGISPIDPGFNKELRAALDSALAEGKYKNVYAANNIEEYFAEGVQTWFNVNTEVSAEHGNGVHNMVNTREELKRYDPRLHAILSRYFPDTDEHVSRHKKVNKYNWTGE